MTPEQLDQIEERAKASDRPPWRFTKWTDSSGRDLDMVKTPHGCLFNGHNGINDPADGEFVAHARTDVPALVAEVRRLRAVVDAVDKIHEPTGTHLVAEIDGFGGEQREIEPDSFEEITSRAVSCMSCAGYPEAPCPTRQAIDAHKEQTA